jgi:Carboxypeptidase regulatory-like domain
MKKHLRKFSSMIVSLTLLLTMVAPVFAQQTLGNVRGVVKDESGAAIAGAKVTIVEKATNKTLTTTSTDAGEYEFKNLPVGEYKMTVEAQGFKVLAVDDVRVQLNQTTDVPATIAAGLTTETVSVSAGGAELIDTTTTNLAKGFEARQVVELAQTSTGSGIYNLALVAPNVSSSGGVGVGTGGSIGGQRPRNNNFVVDGVDNNDKAVTGPQVYISPETVAEFSLLQNQYSAEFARSTGGQFITVTKSGTNEFHGTAYSFFRNRHLNALDTLDIAKGVTRDTSANNPNPNPRNDYGRFGGNIGGPIFKNKLFFFGAYERTQTGAAAGAGAIQTPTAEGFARLSSIGGFSSTNFGIFKQYVPVAGRQDPGASITVGGVEIPVGTVNIPSPSFSYNHYIVGNLDYTQSDKTQHRSRFVYNQNRTIDTAASLPQFFLLAPFDTRLFSYTLIHSFTPNLINETRIGYRRLASSTPAGNFTFPGLDQFPNVGLIDLGVNIGPDGNAPQFGFENNYQLVNNLSWLRGNHSLKFGGDGRKIISPQSFVQRERGDYEYNNTEDFLRDISPEFSERTIGISPFYGDQVLLFAYAQDDWRFRPNLTINLGLNYSWQQLPFTARRQDLNAISTVPGLLEFRKPKSQTKNFGPRIGLAYSPSYDSGWKNMLFGSGNKSSIRAGFSLSYDVIFDNLYILSLPPQFNQTTDVGPGIPNFLGSGGIPPQLAPVASAEDARAVTSAYVPDQQVPYSITYTLSYQREFMKDWGLELRYLGTRGVHLLTQNRINIQSRVTDNLFIPTFVDAPSAGDLAGLRTISQLNAIAPPALIPRFGDAGFLSPVVAFLSNGNSSYNGFSAQVTHRLANGVQFSGAYTWSHLIDDTTAEVFSTVLSPRRVEDFQNLKNERGDSALDHRHRFVASGLYDLPFFTKSEHWLTRTLLGGFTFAGTLTFESGEKATIRSGVDANRNGDNAGDRTIINPNGIKGTASTVHAIDANGNTVAIGSGSTVAYVANDPTAQYIQAQVWAKTNAGRNTLQLPGINNLDFSIFKNFAIRESMKVQFRADFFNAFNHPQFVPGSVNGVEPVGQTSGAVTGLLQTGNINFNRPDRIFTSHPRIIQLALKFNF